MLDGQAHAEQQGQQGRAVDDHFHEIKKTAPKSTNHNQVQ